MEKKKKSNVGNGIIFGFIFGAGFGLVILDNIVLGAGLGMCIGIVIAAILDGQKKETQSN